MLAQALPQPVLAQGAPPPPPQAGVQDQQERRSARRGSVGSRQLSGTVSFHPPGRQPVEPGDAELSGHPGDAFWTEPNAQAVIEVSASRIAMAPGTELDVGDA